MYMYIYTHIYMVYNLVDIDSFNSVLIPCVMPFCMTAL